MHLEAVHLTLRSGHGDPGVIVLDESGVIIPRGGDHLSTEVGQEHGTAQYSVLRRALAHEGCLIRFKVIRLGRAGEQIVEEPALLLGEVCNSKVFFRMMAKSRERVVEGLAGEWQAAPRRPASWRWKYSRSPTTSTFFRLLGSPMEVKGGRPVKTSWKGEVSGIIGFTGPPNSLDDGLFI